MLTDLLKEGIIDTDAGKDGIIKELGVKATSKLSNLSNVDNMVDGVSTYDFDLMCKIRELPSCCVVHYEHNHLEVNSENLDELKKFKTNIKELDSEIYSVNVTNATVNDNPNLDDEEEYLDGYVLVIYLDNTDTVFETEYNTINEKWLVRVNANGEKFSRIKCHKGFKYMNGQCTIIPSTEKANRRRGIKKAVLTRRGASTADRAKTARLVNIAKQKRKSMGL